MIPDYLIKKIIDKAKSLNKFGIDDIAWGKKEAKNLIISLMEDDIGILGGDVYKLDSEHLISLGDGWATDPNEGESKQNYFSRSKMHALDYINRYPIKDSESILFAIVFTERIVYGGGWEDMLNPILSIKEKAEALGENWLLCPLCVDAWQTDSTNAMIRCPQCMEIIHNPKWKKDL